MTEAVDPDPYAPGEQPGRSVLGGREEPGGGDPTAGGRSGEIGETDSIAQDEPDDGGPALPPGGGHVTEDPNTPPTAATGPEASGTSAGAGARAGQGD